jgi:hypothetical protein
LIDISMAVAKSSAVTRRVSVHDNRVRDAEKREEVHKHGDPDDAAANRKQTGAKTGSAGVDAEAKILAGLIVSLGSWSQPSLHDLCRVSRGRRGHGRMAVHRSN